MTRTLSYHARTRAPEPGAPLVFAFHGTGGDEHQFFDLVRQIHPGAGIVSPRGDVSEGGAARYFRRTGEGVYDMEDLAGRTARMAAFVAGHKAAHPGVPVYGFGYSNGANILASVVMARSDLFDRVGLLHPLIPWQPAPADLGAEIAPGVFEAELRYLRDVEFARTGEDVLWRRSKLGLHLKEADREAIARWFEA